MAGKLFPFLPYATIAALFIILLSYLEQAPKTCLD
jgi:hypothetical protein